MPVCHQRQDLRVDEDIHICHRCQVCGQSQIQIHMKTRCFHFQVIPLQTQPQIRYIKISLSIMQLVWGVEKFQGALSYVMTSFDVNHLERIAVEYFSICCFYFYCDNMPVFPSWPQLKMPIQSEVRGMIGREALVRLPLISWTNLAMAWKFCPGEARCSFWPMTGCTSVPQPWKNLQLELDQAYGDLVSTRTRFWSTVYTLQNRRRDPRNLGGSGRHRCSRSPYAPPFDQEEPPAIS